MIIARVGARLLVAASLLSVIPIAANAQQYFGQNQVQYKHFKWRVLETEHFTLHFYPQEREPIVDAARMAERAYTRLSQVLTHQFREKKPIILFASRADFAQNNVTGDLGEGVGGVTEALRHRLIMPFTGDYRSFEHVLAHEMVHEFQYDLLSRGKAGQNLQTLAQLDLPLWFMEGMAEYLAIGPDHALTAAWIRDAAVNGTIPTIRQMTERPDKYFPYRFGEALFQYIGQRWGDAAIGAVLQTVPAVGVERAIRRELGLTTEQLSDDWREAMQAKYLPTVAGLQRPHQFATALLSPRRTRGEIFLAPAFSSDGRYIAFLANGDPKRGDIFIDLWLGDGVTGRRIKKLVKSTLDPNFEELRLLYSQSSFSNNGQRLAFTAQRAGKDVLYLLDVRTQRSVRVDLPLDGVTSPSWSPDDRRIVVSGSKGGITDLYVVDANGRNFRQLTDDKFGDLQPSWSPDGQWVAWASERGQTNLATLDIGDWQISLMNIETGEVRQIPGQGGLNINPVWAPDARSVAFISDRTGIANLFLYDLVTGTHHQLTNVVSGVAAITEYSPAITWARGADRLAFTYYENGDFTVWSVTNPRALKGEPFRPRTEQPAAGVIAEPESIVPASPEQTSTYRAPSGARPSRELSATELERGDVTTTVAALREDPRFGLPDTTRFREYAYRPRFRADYIAQTDIGYTPNYYGTNGFAGGTTIVFSDLLGNHLIAASAQVNGRIQDASVFLAYGNLGRRFQYTTGAFIQPMIFPLDNGVVIPVREGQSRIQFEFARFVQRNVFVVGMYPLNRFTRFETGVQFNSISRSRLQYSFDVFDNGFASGGNVETVERQPALNFVSPSVAWVTDNALFGPTSPLAGRRARAQVTPTVGTIQMVDYLADFRNYLPIRLGTLTFATRFLATLAVGRDEDIFPKYIGRPEYVRGYDEANLFGTLAECNSFLGAPVAGRASEACRTVELVGSRALVGNAELRFPIIRRFDIGTFFGLPPVDGVIFYDAGLAWDKGQEISLRKPDDYDFNLQRYVLTSWGGGFRVNLFNVAILRFDYAIPMARENRKGVWTFSLGPGF
jgi:Tol biopolymer transport system component